MARVRAAENPRSRPKGLLIEEITSGIQRFQELLTSIDDFSQEGFPYRDAARAKAELQLRECVRRIFGERSQEFQTYRNYKLRTSNKTEVAQSVAAVKDLMKTLEDRKLELQGLKPPPTEDSPAEPNPVSPPQMTLVRPAAQITMASKPAVAAPPMTVSVAMTTNLGTPPSPGAVTPSPSTPPPATPVPTPSPIAAPHQPPMTPSLPEVAVPPPVTQSTPGFNPGPSTTPPITPAASPFSPPPPSIREQEAPPAPSTAVAGSAPSGTQPRSEVQPITPAPVDPVATAFPKSEAPGPAPLISKTNLPSNVRTMPDVRTVPSSSEQEPLQLLRKVCLRFHSVARQLRLRKDYRATLEVEDDYDLQDLLCALLKVEFDEVGTEEWTPPYTGGAPRTTLLLSKDQIAVVAKKTRAGLSAKELADQVAADSAYYRAQDKCATLLVFIYDPEGRIGSPKRLETNLTSVSERCTVEVLVAPK